MGKERFFDATTVRIGDNSNFKPPAGLEEEYSIYKNLDGTAIVPDVPPEELPWEDSFDRAARLQAEKEAKSYTERDYLVDMFIKVGPFMGGWSWDEYDNTPQWVVKKISERIDERLANPNKKVLNYHHLAMILLINQIFGDKKEE